MLGKFWEHFFCVLLLERLREVLIIKQKPFLYIIKDVNLLLEAFKIKKIKILILTKFYNKKKCKKGKIFDIKIIISLEVKTFNKIQAYQSQYLLIISW